jgi:glycosyltransferase involved in cell wall biosynthesis
LRLAVFPFLNRSGGGIYQYSLTLLSALDSWATEDELAVVVQASDNHPAELRSDKWCVERLPAPAPANPALSGLRRFVGEGPHREAWRRLRATLSQTMKRPGRSSDVDTIHTSPELSRLFESWNLDLGLYAWPTRMSFETRLPFVMAIHDLQHRLQPEFPEVSANGEWESREYCFRNAARRCTLLLADSEVGKEDILNFYGSYGVTPDKVKVLPFLPASYLNVNVPGGERRRVRLKYKLPERYLFYPAQFWPHKNHLRIVKALGLLKQSHHAAIPMVFCGSHNGELREQVFRDVMTVAAAEGLEADIHNLGYVPDEDISAMYSEAAALVMPTFFGPTNIPVLEAWAYGCPVITSDIRGIREQVSDAGVLVDPRSVEALADGIYRVWSDSQLSTAIAERGRQRLASYTPDDFRRRLIEILEEAKTRVEVERPKVSCP